jgi:diguanylate cyclase (GGDEF)-like protein
MWRYLHKSISRKLAFGVGIPLVVLSLIFVLALVQADRGGRTELRESFLDLLHASTVAVLGAAEEDGHSRGWESLARQVGDHAAVSDLRVLDVEGLAVWTAGGSEVHDYSEYLGDEAGGELLREEQPDLVYVSSRPLPNGDACQGCHESSVSVLGYSQVVYQATAVDQVVLRFQRILGLLSVLPVLVTLVVSTVIVRQLVGRPIRRLARVMVRAEDDHLVRAPVETEDEVGQLAKAFNHMLGRMTALDATKRDAQQALEVVQGELKLKSQLAEQAEIIEETNGKLENRIRDLSILYDISRDIASQRSLEDIYSTLTQVVGEELGYRELSLLLLDQDTQVLTVVATYGFTQDEAEEIHGMTVKVGQGVSGEAAARGEYVLIEDTRKDSRFLHYKGKVLSDGTFLSIPLKVGADVVGVMNFLRPALEGFSQDEIRFLQALADQLAVGINNVKLYQRLTALSATDALTGLPNRRTFEERVNYEIKRANRFERSIGLLMIDIDYFKKFNDTHGHLDGDELLKRFANVLRQNVREVDHIARYGGEEFVVVLPNADLAEASSVAEKLRSRVERTRFRKAETQPGGKITVSIGVALFPDHAQNPEDLLLRADFALYSAKDGGRNRVVVFDEELQEALEKAREAKA